MELQDCCSQVENKTTGEKIGFTNELEDDKHSLNSEKSASKKLNSNQLIDSAPVEFKTIETGEIKCYSFIKRQKFLPWIEKVVLISICVAVAGGFSVPIIMYAVSEDDSSAGNTTTIGKSDNFMIDFDSCSHTIPQEGTTNTSDPGSVLPLYNDKCEEYSGICLEHLNKSNSEISLFTQTLNGISENDISTFASYLNQYSDFINEQCSDVVLPFLCQYAFPPCNVSSGNASYISKTQCTNIRDALCSVEWNLAMQISSSLLPNCQNFNDGDKNNTILPIAPQPLQCHYQFKEFCGVCLPLCGKFSQFKTDVKFRARAFQIFGATTAFIGGILLFIISVYKRKSMFDFPSVLVVYATICVFIMACVMLITYIGEQGRLYCSNERLDIAIDNPSLFCQISGFTLHWASVLVTEFWLLHVIHLFIKIAFPMWSRKLDSKQIKTILHVVEVAVALFLCSLAPVLYVILSKYQLGRFPPIFCYPSKEVSFYTLCLPLCIMLGIGVILAVNMFWMLHKRYQLFAKKSKHFFHISFGVPEVKILILSCYFIIFGITALINYTISFININSLLDALLNYFACQAIGFSPSHTCSAEFDKLMSLSYPEIDSTSIVLLGFYPLINLLFVIQVTDIKKAIQKIVFYYSSHKSKDKTLSTDNAGSKQ